VKTIVADALYVSMEKTAGEFRVQASSLKLSTQHQFVKQEPRYEIEFTYIELSEFGCKKIIHKNFCDPMS
jgi:hypothetical protein